MKNKIGTSVGFRAILEKSQKRKRYDKRFSKILRDLEFQKVFEIFLKKFNETANFKKNLRLKKYFLNTFKKAKHRNMTNLFVDFRNLLSHQIVKQK